ncbi:MAG: hypothetical protein RL160_178 [Bacteroidota bacterium]|jgi:glutamate racemase
MLTQGPIGIFDSGYGGLTILRDLVEALPDYDFVYLGDNARTPYGTRSFETVYEYTLQSVEWLIKQQHCPLVILACNTASAKALRSIQQNDLQRLGADKRVLGVIRPSAEVIGRFTTQGAIGILGTNGTVQSGSYVLEIEKFYPHLKVYQQACPLLVPLIEHGELESEGARWFVQKYLHELLQQSPAIDAILLACTHYPLLMKLLTAAIPEGIRVISQGPIVADSLKDYLFRHPIMDAAIAKKGRKVFYTTDDPETFSRQGSVFFGQYLHALHTALKY